jgi:hypothetical protein
MRTWFITGGTPGGFGMAYAQAALRAEVAGQCAGTGPEPVASRP